MGDLIEWPLSVQAMSNNAGTRSVEFDLALRVWRILDAGMETFENCIKSVDQAIEAIDDPVRRRTLERNIQLIRMAISHSSEEMSKAVRIPLSTAPGSSDIVA